MDENERIDASAVEIVDELYKRNPDDKSIDLLWQGLAYTPDSILDEEARKNKGNFLDLEEEQTR